MRILIFLGALLLSGCFMQPVQLPEIHKYQLTACFPAFFVPAKSDKVLFVNVPQAIYPYNSTHMVYGQKPNEVSYFAQNRWVSPPGQMMLPLIVQAIRNAGYFKAVIGPSTVADTDYRLDVTLLLFKQEFFGNRSQVHIVLDAVLMSSKTATILATRRIDVCVPSCPTPASGVLAYQCALNKALVQLIQFVTRCHG